MSTSEQSSSSAQEEDDPSIKRKELAGYVLGTPNGMQKVLHSSYKDGDVTIQHVREPKPVSLTTIGGDPYKLSSQMDGPIVSYQVSHDDSYLDFCYFHLKLPNIRVKDGSEDRLRISWSPNLFHRMVKKAFVKFEGMGGNVETAFPFDTNTLDVYMQLWMSPEKRLLYEPEIGRHRRLTGWTTELPAHTLNPWIPWPFNLDPHSAIPLFMCSPSSGKMTINMLFNTDYHQLLRFSAKDSSGKWSEVEVDLKLLEPIEPMPEPECWAYGSLAPSHETSFLSKDKTDGSNKQIFIQHREFCHLTSADTVSGGKTSEAIKIAGLYPVECIHVMAQLTNSLNVGANYTISPKGDGPGAVSHVTCDFPSEVFFSLDTCHMKAPAIAMGCFPGVPSEEGYYTRPMGRERAYPHGASGLELPPNTTLKMKITDSRYKGQVEIANEHSNLIDRLLEKQNAPIKRDEGDGKEYRCHVILVTTKVLVFSLDAPPRHITPKGK